MLNPVRVCGHEARISGFRVSRICIFRALHLRGSSSSGLFIFRALHLQSSSSSGLFIGLFIFRALYP